MVAHHPVSSKIAESCRSDLCKQEIEEKLVTHNVNYAHIKETHAIDFFEQSRVAHQTLHNVCERFFLSQTCCRNVSNFPRFYILSRRDFLVIKPKRVMHAKWIESLDNAIFIA